MQTLRHTLLTGLATLLAGAAVAQSRPLHELQQEFVNLRFGMFIHFNMPTFSTADWPDPDTPVEAFDPKKLDCGQWADAALSARMSYGCLTTKHHSGFCLWNTKTTDYNAMNSPCGRDVVREYVDAFRSRGLEVMLYYSILDTHHKLRPGWVTPEHVEMVKAQLTELLTSYGPIRALIIDGWDAPWSRISYEAIPFDDIYRLVKKLQPECLVMDLNAAKYPAEALFYTDIKSYEQAAGQHISKENNRLPALSCLPLNKNWFWKEHFPTSPVKDPEAMVRDNIVPMNRAYCNFILNAAPNRDGLIDDNALAALKRIGELWQPEEVPALPPCDAPVTARNIAKHCRTSSSWSEDMLLMDFAADDDFETAWYSSAQVRKPWFEVRFEREEPFDAITIAEGDGDRIEAYRIEYYGEGEWHPLVEARNDAKVKIHRFDRVWGDRVRIHIDRAAGANPSIAELGVYDEKR